MNGDTSLIKKYCFKWPCQAAARRISFISQISLRFPNDFMGSAWLNRAVAIEKKPVLMNLSSNRIESYRFTHECTTPAHILMRRT